MAGQQSGNAEFSIRLQKGDLAVEIASSDAAWVEAKLAECRGLLGMEPEGTRPGSGAASKASASRSKGVSLAEHVRAVAPSGGVEHVLAVGYYLERHAGLSAGFRRRDVAEAFAALRYQHSNPGVPIGAARRRGLLMDGEEHEKMLLTKSAERWVAERLQS